MVKLIKFCGFTHPADLDVALGLGVEAIGLNLVSASPRCLRDEGMARRLAEHCLGRARVVWIVDKEPPPFFHTLINAYPLSYVQRVEPSLEWPDGLGAERKWDVVRLQREADVSHALELSAPILVCDAHSALGGSGRLSNWDMAALLAKQRKVILAGGLIPTNVAKAIATVRPFGVDVSSGIESQPGRKDHEKMRAFVRAARA